MKNCLNCHVDFVPYRINRKQLFCSKSCYLEFIEKNSSKIVVSCAQCNKLFKKVPSSFSKSKSGLYFCSKVCKDKAQKTGGIAENKPINYKNGVWTYRSKALNHFGFTCNKCNYSEDDRMLDVHHLDGNRENNDISNLEVLCVWCHALETRKNWKARRA